MFQKRRQATGAVELGRLVQLAGDVLQAGQEVDHDVAGPAPDQDDDDHHLGPLRRPQPVDRPDPEQAAQTGVHQAELRVEDQGEHQGDDDRREDDRDEVAGPQEVARPHPPAVQGQRQQQRQGADQEEAGRRVPGGIDGRVVEALVPQHVAVVAPADPLHLADARPLVEADPESLGDRVGQEESRRG